MTPEVKKFAKTLTDFSPWRGVPAADYDVYGEYDPVGDTLEYDIYVISEYEDITRLPLEILNDRFIDAIDKAVYRHVQETYR